MTVMLHQDYKGALKHLMCTVYKLSITTLCCHEQLSQIAPLHTEENPELHSKVALSGDFLKLSLSSVSRACIYWFRASN